MKESYKMYLEEKNKNPKIKIMMFNTNYLEWLNQNIEKLYLLYEGIY